MVQRSMKGVYEEGLTDLCLMSAGPKTRHPWEVMGPSQHPLATLLSAPTDRGVLKTLRDQLASQSTFQIRVEVRPDALMVMGPVGRRAFPDPEGTNGLCGRLARSGVSALIFTPQVNIYALSALLRFAQGGPHPADEPWPGLYFEQPFRRPRTEESLFALAEAVLEDPKTGFDLSLFFDSDPQASIDPEHCLRNVMGPSEVTGIRRALRQAENLPVEA